MKGFRRGVSSCSSRPPDRLDRYAVLLRECGNLRDYTRGRQVHQELVRDGLFGRFLGNLLVEMYGKCGRLDQARGVFDEIRAKNVYTWNIMAGAYVENRRDRFAIRLYREMLLQGVEIDEFTILAVIAACSSIGSFRDAVSVLECIQGGGILENPNSLVGSAVISMFGRCGSIFAAKRFFDEEIPCRSRGSWNAMLAAYSQNGFGADAMRLFRAMQLDGVESDSVTMVSALDACGCLGNLADAKILNGLARSCGIDSDLIVGNALISAYGRCKSCSDSRDVFESLHSRNIVSWTAAISAYAQNGHHREALELFESIDCEPDPVVLSSVLDSCGSLCDLDSGRAIHRRHCKILEESSLQVGNALVKFYARCGAVEDAVMSFARMSSRDVQSWSSLISAFAQSDRSGSRSRAAEMLCEMLLEGVRPNEFVLTHVLDACSHLGLVSRACGLFACMGDDHGVAAGVEHYGCVVDLLGRLGELEGAEEVIEAMPVEADAVMLLILLSACSVHGDVERGGGVAQRIAMLDRGASACFVLVANSVFNFLEK